MKKKNLFIVLLLFVGFSLSSVLVGQNFPDKEIDLIYLQDATGKRPLPRDTDFKIEIYGSGFELLHELYGAYMPWVPVHFSARYRIKVTYRPTGASCTYQSNVLTDDAMYSNVVFYIIFNGTSIDITENIHIGPPEGGDGGGVLPIEPGVDY